ncbi:trifunctional nucleotide phosphoesterase protein YfkN-like isoform X3 [Rhincodon typus]|uniref:trifunctional nucleotide phosphoesterase protein YfkN-like isoform X3 n=1 Tax=Rhincodon typus TaxID=259920 RepID=UPI00202EF5F5|nr:trifunctional nucleotide phosphoesterase protein YfkN-like isoform X3 [Rhincodon typus]
MAASTVSAVEVSPEGAAPLLTILHFNDVYEIQPRSEEPVGGASRFATALKQYKALNPLILFSGDCLNPSLLSTTTKGRHMIPILNAFGVQCAVFGNHEFDFGVDLLEDVISEMNFPWLLSNVYDLFTSEPLGHGIQSKIIEWNGVKVGLMGLVEEEWIDTLATIDKSSVNFIDYVIVADQLSQELRAKGGHDHDYGTKEVNGTLIIKSGSDFRSLSKVDITRTGENNYQCTTQKIEITKELEEDTFVNNIVQEFTFNLEHLLGEVLCQIEVELDGRFTTVRKSESSLGNLVTNAMLEATHADVALLNSGTGGSQDDCTLRSDRLHPPGDFTMHDLLLVLPIVDPLLVVQVTAEQLLDALENGVSMYPELDGRFPQVAGLEFGFDPSAEPGHRIVADSVKVQGQYLDRNRTYLLAIKEYLAKGKDGYVMFRNCQWLVDTETAPSLSTVVINHFESVKILQGLKKCKSGHRMSLIKVSQAASITDFEKKADDKIVVAPVPDVEGRIYHVTKEMKQHLRQLRSERELGQRTFPLDLCNANNSLGCELK